MLLLARESGLLRLGTVSIDGAKIEANASKIRLVRYDRAQALREKLAADIAELTAKAEAADAEDSDPQALPAEIARREVVAACNFSPPLKTLKGLTPDAFIGKQGTSQPERFRLNPLHQTPGLNS